MFTLCFGPTDQKTCLRRLFETTLRMKIVHDKSTYKTKATTQYVKTLWKS